MAILEIEVEKNTTARIAEEKEGRNESRLYSAAPLESNPREIVQHNFNLAASALGLSEEQKQLLQTPFREVKLEVPVRMDDGSLRVFLGYRIQHNGARDRLRAASAISQP